MLKVGITRSTGLLGWHLRCALIDDKELSAVPADRRTFCSEVSLEEFAAECDVIVHFAGMNRGDDPEIYRTNEELTERLISAIDRTGRAKHIVFSSSTPVLPNTEYGRSKRNCSALFEAWAAKTGGAIFTELALPNVFGEGGRPFYNSVVSTFCFQLANEQSPEIKIDAEIELLHGQRVADVVLNAIRNRLAGQHCPDGTSIQVSALLKKLCTMDALYKSHIVPSLQNTFDLDLFNTLRSYLYPAQYPVRIPLHADSRGVLFEAIKTHNGGQAFVSSTKAGIVRGNHFHRRKVERFLVIGGTAEIRIRKLFGQQTESFRVSGDDPAYIDLPTLHTHNIKNTGQHDLTTVFWAHEIFDTENPDTFAEEV